MVSFVCERNASLLVDRATRSGCVRSWRGLSRRSFLLVLLLPLISPS